jgi:meromycolic acid enoyl-[acyl-carrier-protein] reductase
MGLLDGKRIVITGVLTDASLAYGVAQLAIAEGAEIVLTGAGRGLSLTQRTARKLGTDIPVLGPRRDRARAARRRTRGPRERVGSGRRRAPRHRLRTGQLPRRRLHGGAVGGRGLAMHVSTYSLKALAEAFAPLMTEGGSLVGLDFDNTVAWPAYNWMGVAKSALES